MGKDFVNPWGITTPKGEERMMSSLLNSAVFPGIQGDARTCDCIKGSCIWGSPASFRRYQKQVKDNAEVMARAFIERGYNVISGGTDNHLPLIDLRRSFRIFREKKQKMFLQQHI